MITHLQPAICTPLRCRWPRPYHVYPLWYEKEIEGLEARRHELWARYEACGDAELEAKLYAHHARLVNRIMRLHKVALWNKA